MTVCGVSVLGLMPLHLDEMNFAFANDVVARGDMTIVMLIKSTSEGPLLPVPPIPITMVVVLHSHLSEPRSKYRSSSQHCVHTSGVWSPARTLVYDWTV